MQQWLQAEFPLYCGALPEMNTLCKGRKIVKGVAKNKQGVASASQ